MGLPQRYLLSRRAPWYRQEQRLPAPIVCGYMARKDQHGASIRFYRNKSQAIAANVYLLLYPKPLLTHYCPDVGVWLDEMFQLLLTLAPEQVVGQGRTYGGGLDKIEPNELGRVAFSDTAEARRLSAFLHPLMAF